MSILRRGIDALSSGRAISGSKQYNLKGTCALAEYGDADERTAEEIGKIGLFSGCLGEQTPRIHTRLAVWLQHPRRSLSRSLCSSRVLIVPSQPTWFFFKRWLVDKRIREIFIGDQSLAVETSLTKPAEICPVSTLEDGEGGLRGGADRCRFRTCRKVGRAR